MMRKHISLMFYRSDREKLKVKTIKPASESEEKGVFSNNEVLSKIGAQHSESFNCYI